LWVLANGVSLACHTLYHSTECKIFAKVLMEALKEAHETWNTSKVKDTNIPYIGFMVGS